MVIICRRRRHLAGTVTIELLQRRLLSAARQRRRRRSWLTRPLPPAARQRRHFTPPLAAAPVPTPPQLAPHWRHQHHFTRTSTTTDDSAGHACALFDVSPRLVQVDESATVHVRLRRCTDFLAVSLERAWITRLTPAAQGTSDARFAIAANAETVVRGHGDGRGADGDRYSASRAAKTDLHLHGTLPWMRRRFREPHRRERNARERGKRAPWLSIEGAREGKKGSIPTTPRPRNLLGLLCRRRSRSLKRRQKAE